MFSFLMELVKIDTNANERKNYWNIARVIEEKAKEIGLNTYIHVHRDDKGEVPNVIAWADLGADKNLVLLSHYDVVPAGGLWRLGDKTFEPFDPLRINGKIYGRGAADDKSAIALSLSAASMILSEGKAKYNPVVVVVGDEEVGGTGVFAVAEKGFKEAGIRPDRVIVIDAAPDFVGIGASGVIGGEIIVKGRGGHAGRPFVAINPVHLAIRIADDLLTGFAQQHASCMSVIPSPPGSPVPKVWGRFSITIMRAGEKHNVIPDKAVLGFDIRFIPEEEKDSVISKFLAAVSSIAARYGANVEVNIHETLNPGWMTDPDHEFVLEVLDSYEKFFGNRRVAGSLGGNDGFIFARKGIPTVSLGTIGLDSRAHADLENVEEEIVIRIRDLLVDLMTP